MPEYEVSIDGKPRRVQITGTGEESFSVETGGKLCRVELSKGKVSFEKPFTLKMNEKTYQIHAPEVERGQSFQIKVDEVSFKAEVKIPSRKLASPNFETTAATTTKRTSINKKTVEGAVTAPMTGKIISIKVRKGDQVKVGQALCTIEAMKMENEIIAVKSGTVKEVYVSEGASVAEGEVILTIG
jgi:biotin carboxyl carrier protein